MEVGRFVVAAAFFGLAGASLALMGNDAPTLTVTEAELHPMGRGMALVAQINNEGRPDRLTGIGSDAAMEVSLRGGSSTAFAIPADSTPSLAMDGGHGMLMGLQGDTSEGRLIPVTFWFENAGRVTTRARIIGKMAMDHGQVLELPGDDTAPTLDLIVRRDADTWSLSLATTNFTFSSENVDGPHEPGIGHGHLYLNGLKLQRVYEASATIGALPPGTYEIYVSLNTNDHKAYTVDGLPVGAAATIVVD